MKSSGRLPKSNIINSGNSPVGRGGYPCPLLFCIIISFFIIGCSHGGEDSRGGPNAAKTNDLFSQRNYAASIARYKKRIKKSPETADRMLFEMGIIYAHPGNQQKNYAKALQCFEKIIKSYPHSDYRRDSQMMVLQIQNVIIKDNLIAEQQTQIEAYRLGIKSREKEISLLKKKMNTLERKVFDLRTEPVDKVLIEKKKRQLKLIAKGKTIKTYKIALGGDPEGPKVKKGDKKTPEGTYFIKSRNRNSEYHLSLRISYPNEKDKKRAKKLGVDPGGDIMIHGIKNGLSYVGAFHTKVDWTEGCIAVTNREMEEIARLVPNGTPVEIRP